MGQIDEQVDVASVVVLATCDRAEQTDVRSTRARDPIHDESACLPQPLTTRRRRQRLTLEHEPLTTGEEQAT